MTTLLVIIAAVVALAFASNAVRRHRARRGEALLKDIETARSKSPVFTAVVERNPSRLRQLLHDGADPDERANNGTTALCQAVVQGNSEMVRLLLDHGAGANSPSNGGKTPLHFASTWGHNGIVEILSARGANPETKDDNGRTPQKATLAAAAAEVQLAEDREFHHAVSRLLRYDKCFRCGSGWTEEPRVTTRGALAANLAGGAVVSGRLWYCHRCEIACCIPCSATTAEHGVVGLICPTCGGHYLQQPPWEALKAARDVVTRLGIERLCASIKANDLGRTERLLQPGVDPNAEDSTGATPLDCAQSHDAERLLRTFKAWRQTGRRDQNPKTGAQTEK